MSQQPLIQHREDETKSPGRAISFVFPMILFLGGLALFASRSTTTGAPGCSSAASS